MERWDAVDAYVQQTMLGDDAVLTGALRASADAGLPSIAVSPPQGAFLALLVSVTGARRVLEVGTLGGYSTIWLARALPSDGHLLSIELEPHHAAVARDNLARAGLGDRVEVRVGRALEVLAALAESGSEPYDLVFLDADKPHNPDYLTWALRLTRPGSLIVVDNVVRDGAVADASSDDAAVAGSRRVLELIGAEPRLTGTVLQTVGSKGYDGFAIARVSASDRGDRVEASPARTRPS